MKKILLFMVFCPFLIFSQTKKESEEWIRKYYNNYFCNNQLNSIKTDIDFDGQSMIIYEDIDKIQEDKKVIDLSKVRSIKYLPNEVGLGKVKYQNILLICDTNCVKLNSLYYGEHTQQEFKILSLCFKSEMSENDISKRMLTALTHIIKLNGGVVKIKKEAF